MRTVTIRGVELARLGSWAASTGPVNLTPQDFADAIAAGQDPEIDHGPIKIGHVDPRMDGEPALGWITNLRTSPDGRVLVGDLEDVPAALAEPDTTTGKTLMSTAYRRRSVELAWGVRTPGGKSYRMVVTGLALLGVTPPAVKGLADVAAIFGDVRRTAAAAVPTATSTSSLLIGHVDAGELDQARQAVAALASSSGAPPAALASLTEALEGLAGVGLSGIPHVDVSAGETGTVNEQRLREILGLEASADLERAITDLKARAAADPAGTPAGTPPPAPAGTAAPAPQSTATPAPPAPAAPAATAPTGTAAPPAAPAATAPATPAAGTPAPAGDLVGAGSALAGQPGAPQTVMLSAGQWQAIEALLTSQTADRRTKLVDGALHAGRIHPSERAAYLSAMETNEAATTSLLGALAPNKFPTSELGSDALAAGGAGALGAPADEAAWADFGASIGVPALGVVATPATPPAAPAAGAAQ